GSTILILTSVLLPWAVKKIEQKIPFKVRELQILGISKFEFPRLTEWLPVEKGDPVYGGNWVKRSIDKLKEDPRIERAIVSRSMTGNVMIQIGERKNEALVNLNRLQFIDRDANLLGPVSPQSIQKIADLVTFTGPWGGKRSIHGFENQLKEGIVL